MDSKTYNKDIDELKKALKSQRTANVLLSAAMLIAFLYVAMIHGSERTVITPGGMHQSMWLTDKSMSESGLTQWAQWMSWLKLDVSPDSVDYKNNLVLKHTHPSKAGAMKERQQLDADTIKKENLASTFAIKSITANEQKLSAVLTGRLETYVNKQMVSSPEKHFFIRFTVNSATPQLQIFKEVQHADIGKLIEENPL